MPEEKPDVVEVEHEEFVARAVIENARNMARFSIGQTPSPNFASERVTDLEVARYLSGVEVDDKSLAQKIKEALDRNLADPDGAFQVASVAVAKAEAAKEVASPKQKGFFERVSDKVAKEAGKLIASKSGKRGLAVVSGLSLATTACGQVAQGAESSRPIDLETPTQAAREVFTPTTEAPPTPEATSIPTTEPTPTPTPTPALFEYNFQVGEAGQVPEELRDLISGEVVLNRSEDAGGNISLEEVRREGYTPLVGEGDVLSVEVGEVAFLPFPSELSGYAYSAENSGSGFAAYVDQQGEVRMKMLTTLPVTEDANYVVTFSSNRWGGRGDIYGLILNSAGDIVSRIDIAFTESEELESTIVNGEVRIYIDGERMILEDGKFVRPKAGYSRGLELSALPPELTTEISPEQIRNLRFMDSQGNPLPYGYLGEEEYLTGEGEVGLEILRFHAIFRGRIPDAALPGLPPEALEYSDYYLIEIPQERLDSTTEQYVRTGESQFIIMVSMNDRLAAEIEVYWMSNNQIDFSQLPIPRYTQRPQVGEVFRRMPPGTSIIVGIQNVPNTPEYEWLRDFLLSQEQAIPVETDGWFIPETLFLPGNLR